MPAYVLTFTDYTPSAREDGAVWTEVQIFESAQQAGPWTLIDTKALSPLDTDPTQPQPRSFTTENATMQAGWYKVVFLDDANGQSLADPVFNNPQRSGYMPGVGDVAVHLTARTRDSNGNEAGTFTALTRPTREQVERLIEKAAQRTLSKLGDTPPAALHEQISNVIALAAAMRVELSFFPDQITAGRSPFNELKALRDEEWADLYIDWRNLGPDGIPGTADDVGEGGLPSFSFPPLGPGIHAPGSEPACDGSDWLDW